MYVCMYSYKLQATDALIMQTLNGCQEKQIIHKTTHNNTSTLLVHYLVPRHTQLIPWSTHPHILPQGGVSLATKEGVEAVAVTRMYSSKYIPQSPITTDCILLDVDNSRVTDTACSYIHMKMHHI